MNLCRDLSCRVHEVQTQDMHLYRNAFMRYNYYNKLIIIFHIQRPIICLLIKFVYNYNTHTYIYNYKYNHTLIFFPFSCLYGVFQLFVWLYNYYVRKQI